MNKIITHSFTDSFIDKVASYIEENYFKTGKDLSRLAIVFGGKRPALFLKRSLAQRKGGVFHSPQFFSIDEFISYCVRKEEFFTPAQDVDSCYLLYQLIQKHASHILDGRATFAQFLPWTREILAFMDQLDLENIDDQKLRNIEANAEIGYAVPQDINRLLENIVTLRQIYHAQLLKEKTYSRGLQYRRAAQTIEKVSFTEFDEIVFCNFFYFNRCEQQVIENLYQRQIAVLIFQGDERKWPVLKRIARALETKITEGDQLPSAQFDLKLYSSFDLHSQVATAREIIKEIKDRSPADLSKTVIVMPNPNHIIPLISELTPLVGDFNISLGYPLKRSSLYTLFGYIFQSQLSKKDHRYYAKDYLKAMGHPFIKNLRLGSDPVITRVLIHKIEEILTGKAQTPLSGSLFFELEDMETLDELYMLTSGLLDRMGLGMSRAQLQAILVSIHELLFAQWETVVNFHDFASGLGRLLDMLIDKSFLHHYPLNINIVQKMYAIQDEFLRAAFKKEHFPQEDIFRIFDSKISREVVAFVGSPLKDLQILGLFETRSLNFENVIMLDVNEGALPTLQIYEPLIPREVMIGLNLDRLELEEEIQRYQFMRLISSAKQVHLIYQEGKDKERSRFIEELIWEQEKQGRQKKIIPMVKASFEAKVSSYKRAVKKTPEMLEVLKCHRYSASSVNAYLRNPLEFYYKYVLQMQEEEDLLDEPQARQVGTFAHELLEHCFRTFLNNKPLVNAGFRRYFQNAFEKKFDDTFGRSMKADAFLIKSVLAERLNRFLDNEEFNPERQIEKILYLENRFEDVLPLAGAETKFIFIVDRIDELKDTTIMILDYKTGSIDQMPGSFEKIANLKFSRENIRDQIKSFQLPLYFYYLNKQFPGRPVNAGLYNLRTLEIKKFISKGMPQKTKEELLAFYLRALDFVIQEILDPKVDFVEDEVK